MQCKKYVITISLSSEWLEKGRKRKKEYDCGNTTCAFVAQILITQGGGSGVGFRPFISHIYILSFVAECTLDIMFVHRDI